MSILRQREAARERLRDLTRKHTGAAPSQEPPERLADPILDVLHDTDWERIAGEYMDELIELAPPEITGPNIAARRISQLADAGKWADVAQRLFYLIRDVEEYYAETP